MTYSNFTRPLWQWLADTEARVDFFGTLLDGPNRVGAETWLRHAPGSLQCLQLARALVEYERAEHPRHRPGRQRDGPGGQIVGAAWPSCCRAFPWSLPVTSLAWRATIGESSRTPMPWDEPDRVVTDLRADYAALAALRHEQPRRADGGMRWLMAEGDVLAYVREAAEESILLIATRAAATVALERFGPGRWERRCIACGSGVQRGRACGNRRGAGAVRPGCVRVASARCGSPRLASSSLPTPHHFPGF